MPVIALPPQYEYLYFEPGPKMLVELLKLYGVEELLGEGDNPQIIAWAKETGQVEYKHDATAWCGLTIAVAAKRAGYDCDPQGNALWARTWAKWGKAAPLAMLGDILVFPRGPGGHVAMYVGEDKTHYHILGGNQSDKVTIVRKPKKPIVAIRRSPFKIAQPHNVRTILLDAKGPVSIREA